ncbi:MAG: DegT/DnrJ/EryC1/StrS family aminotransferase [Synergistaceae bacterium]|nr:DegT/DnrJ/EryC1/StrS family aminotransferase [Synergistaceae bacterium]
MINVFGSSVGAEELKNVSESINNQWMGMGPKTKEFEKRMSERLAPCDFMLTDSGSNSLYLALTLLNLPKDSEVILPSFTWVSCAQAVILAGCKPVFCDVDLQTQNLTVDTVKSCVTSKTSAIMAVHYAGLPVDVDPIRELGYPIIEDAAHAVDSIYKGRRCGTLGTVSAFSFDAVKNLSMGEGGGVASGNLEYMQRAKILRYCGIGKSGFEASTHGKEKWWEYNISEAFIKMNPSDIAAGIGLAQLEKLDKLQAYRRKIWNLYQEAFKEIDWISTPSDANEGDQHSYFTYFIRVPERNRFAQYLLDKGIYTTLRYHPLHMNALYKSDKVLPNCEKLNEEGLNIPLHPSLSMENVEYIIDTIRNFN